jgi:hypothetical protein
VLRTLDFDWYCHATDSSTGAGARSGESRGARKNLLGN